MKFRLRWSSCTSRDVSCFQLSVRSLANLYPDLPLETALRLLSTAPLLPVVHRADANILEGVISRDDILAKYQQTDSGENPNEK